MTLTLAAQGIRFGFGPRTGLLDGFVVEEEGQEVAPSIARPGSAPRRPCRPKPPP